MSTFLLCCGFSMGMGGPVLTWSIVLLTGQQPASFWPAIITGVCALLMIAAGMVLRSREARP